MKHWIHVISITILGIAAFLLVFGRGLPAQTAQVPTHKPTAHPEGTMPMKAVSGRVTSVHAEAAPATFNGGCSGAGKRIMFHATIMASGPAEVKYTWLRSDGATDTNPHGVKFTAAGTKQVSDYWEIAESYNGWEALRVTAPNEITSAHASFHLTCATSKPAHANLPSHPSQTVPAVPKPGHTIH